VHLAVIQLTPFSKFKNGIFMRGRLICCNFAQFRIMGCMGECDGSSIAFDQGNLAILAGFHAALYGLICRVLFAFILIM
jgi:hypothetical protein